MHSLFVKPTHRRWTHISPDKKHKHKLDHIFANGKYVTDVSIISVISVRQGTQLIESWSTIAKDRRNG
ncbi:hypothetical protein CRE_00134 [Caenorhabditis remanei]|uniref:Uncharacterized protein n=1 Tax=Caenorhabditis remanei TaxID=31234 RepID=E3LDB7_CAERE|nr:hypothetical protein CRE_00134 [Caenorhabditis remanei]